MSEGRTLKIDSIEDFSWLSSPRMWRDFRGACLEYFRYIAREIQFVRQKIPSFRKHIFKEKVWCYVRMAWHFQFQATWRKMSHRKKKLLICSMSLLLISFPLVLPFLLSIPARTKSIQILSIIHSIEECPESLAFATEPILASLANVLAYQVCIQQLCGLCIIRYSVCQWCQSSNGALVIWSISPLCAPYLSVCERIARTIIWTCEQKYSAHWPHTPKLWIHSVTRIAVLTAFRIRSNCLE